MRIAVYSHELDGTCQVYEEHCGPTRLSDLVAKYNTTQRPCEALLGGTLIRPQELSVIYADNQDVVIIRPIVRGFLAPLLAAWKVWAAAHPILSGILVSMAVSFIGGIIVRAIVGKPSATDAGGPSPWAQHTVSQEGIPIPRYYGRSRLYGNIVMAWRSTSESDHFVEPEYILNVAQDWPVATNSYAQKQILNMVIALGEGPVEGIIADSQRINEQPIDNFPGVTVAEKTGTIAQTAFADITEIPLEYQCDIITTVTDGAIIYTVPVSDMDVVELTMSLPKGLVYMSKGKSKIRGVRYRIELSEAGENVWNTLFDGWILANTLKPIYATYRNTGTYDGGAAVDMSGWDGCDIRVTKVTTTERGDGDNMIEFFDELHLYIVHAIYSVAPKFPKQSMVFIQAMQTEKLNGNMRFDCLQDGAIVNTYDGTSWTIQFSDNPAWAILDMITQPVITGGPGTWAIDRYLGMNPNQVDLDSLYEVAQFCDTLVTDGEGSTHKRCIVNGGFLRTANVWQDVLAMCDSIRVAPVWDGYSISFVIDQAGTPLQLFNVGNIIQDSFKLTYLPQSDRASEIEIRYRDENTDYNSGVPIVAVDESRETLGNSVAVEMPFCTRQAEAWRYGRFKMLQNKLLLRSIQFNVDTDALVCGMGDLFYFQHDKMNTDTMIGGRVISATANTIVVNRNAELAGSLKVLVRVYNPATGTWAFEDEAVTDVTNTTITLTGTWTIQPKHDDMWIMGTATTYNKTYRITKLEFRGDKTTAVHAIEYNADVYNCDTDTPALQSTCVYEPQSAGQQSQPALLDILDTAIQDGGTGAGPADVTEIQNVTLANNDPGAGEISWNHLALYYPIEINYHGTLYPIASGSTSLTYVYWYVGASNVLTATDDLADIATNNGTLLYVNDGGAAVPALDSYNEAIAHVTMEDAIDGLVFCDGAGNYSAKVIGADVQAWDDDLDDIAALTPADGNFIVGNDTDWIVESGNTARTSLGLGTNDSPTFDAPIFSTFLTCPKIIGGVETTSDLVLQTTSGIGATGANMSFCVGNNGATEAIIILNSGYVGVGTSGPLEKLQLHGNFRLDGNITDGTNSFSPANAKAAYDHSQIAGGDSVHVSTTENTNWDTAYSHSQLVAGNPHSVTPAELSLVIGTDVQAHGDILDDLNAVGAVTTDSEFLVGTAAGVFDWESGATVRTSLGLGTGDKPTFLGATLTAATSITTTGSGGAFLIESTSDYIGFTLKAPDGVNTYFEGTNSSGKVWGFDLNYTGYIPDALAITTNTANLDILIIPHGTGNIALGGNFTPLEKVHCNATIRADTHFNINGTDVIGAQGAAVADATDAATAITQLNALLARCRAHGLIAT